MHLTIISADDDRTFAMEIDSSMLLDDVKALVGAESGQEVETFNLVWGGEVMSQGERTVESYGLSNGEEIVQMVTIRASGPSSSSGDPMENDIERMRLSMLGNPALMSQIARTRPELAQAIRSNPAEFATLIRREFADRSRLESEKNSQIDLLNADPYDVEAQKKIEEAIRQQAVLENMEHAMEYSPESFGNVTMLYIDVEVNGTKVKAFVDSGAQSTIISPDCAEKCGIMRLVDKRFQGVARGVGTAKILGRIHSAQIRLKDLFLPVGFTVLEGRDVDLLFGLDMLKRHQACIDLEKNCLRIQGREISFLAEHELPAKARGMEELAQELEAASVVPGAKGIAPTTPHPVPSSSTPSFPGAGHSLAPSGPSATPQSNPASSFPEADIQAIVNLGVSREQAIQTLTAVGGNVDMAASLLF